MLNFVVIGTKKTIHYNHTNTSMKNATTTAFTSSTAYKTVKIDDLSIFYREAGTEHAQTILFLHGFPSSSHMYRDIIADLSAKYHVIAPDYPGFGLSSCPSPQEFDYTFDHLAAVMEKFIDALGINQLSLYVQDYGGPIGFRIASKRPELIQSLLIQNANAYLEGLGPEVHKMRQLEQTGDIEGLQATLDYMLSYEGIKQQYVYGAQYGPKVNPDSYLSDHHFIERPGNKEIQATLLGNYKTNFPQYENWQHYFRLHQPRTLIVWGKNDPIFIVPGAEAYLRDLPNATLHLLEGGHFVLEEHHQVIASLIDHFLANTL